MATGRSLGRVSSMAPQKHDPWMSDIVLGIRLVYTRGLRREEMGYLEDVVRVTFGKCRFGGWSPEYRIPEH